MKSIISSATFYCVCVMVATATSPSELVHLANPLQGTDSVREFSHGNTYPAISLPFPMNKWAPYTQPAKDPFFYQYRQNKLRGIRQTHQPSPWIGDYANFSLMPVFGKLAVTEDDRASEFRHETEIARPSYYSVRLDTWKAKMEVTPTERAAGFRFTFEEAGDGYVVLDAFDKGSEVEIIPAEKKGHRHLPKPCQWRAEKFRQLLRDRVRQAIRGFRHLDAGSGS